MSDLVEEMWNDHLGCTDVEHKKKLKAEIKEVAPDAAYSFWNLGNWENFKRYVRCLDPTIHPYERSFYQAVLDSKITRRKLLVRTLRRRGST
jgi:hypothetical protein